MKKEEAVYSLDEDNPFRETGPSPFRFEKNKKAAILAFIDKNFDDILLSLLQWDVVFNSVKNSPFDMKPCLERIKNVQTKEGLKAIFHVEPKTKKKGSKKRKESESSDEEEENEEEEEDIKKQKVSDGKLEI